MGLLGWILLGLIAGFIAKAIMPGDDPGGIIVTMLLGIVGALLGGFLAKALFADEGVENFFDLGTWVCAIAGSLLVLFVYKAVVGGRSRGGLARR